MAARCESQGLCVYGVMRARRAPALSVAGVEGRPVRAIETGPLAVLVSDAPAGLVNANRRNLIAHRSVLQEAVKTGCVLPMPFGVVMPNETAVREELLRDGAHELFGQLADFDELVELDLSIVCPDEVLMRTVLADRPELAALSARLRGRPPDATHYERIRLGELVSRASAEKRKELLRLVVDRVEPLAVETDVGEPSHGQMLVNAAFLTHRARVGDVEEVVQRVNEELAPGLRLKCVGPLPPYRFVETVAGGGSVAWTHHRGTRASSCWTGSSA
jgi:hypothetical protein